MKSTLFKVLTIFILLLSLFSFTSCRDSSEETTKVEVAETVADDTEEIEYLYSGSVNSDKFHAKNCSAALKIKPENLVTFVSRDDAISSSRVPCKNCKP
jgi:hypothetical protein